MAATHNIPEFDERGLLPDGIYPATEPHIESRFVDEFNGSETRRPLFRGLCQWRRDATEARITSAVQWVDGSFVESKDNPNDVDVLTLIHYDDLNELAVCGRTFSDRWMSKGRAQDRYGIDSKLQAYCEPEHSYYKVWESARRTYSELFGTMRDNSTRKGFIELLLGEVADARLEAVRPQ